ncbi:MAG TPA: NAD-binding protein [Phototrophicaceae bacterium]|jgi:voltage-gated potassium channel Kch|nr:NAD-binding protein [Phototrophicaceae bacterium]
MSGRKITLSDRLRYWFDNTMSRGTGALIAWLALLTLILIVVATVLAAIFVPSVNNPLDIAWFSLMHAMDAGAIGGDPLDDGGAYLAIMMFVTLGGIFILSTLIGVLNSGIEARLDELRKGRSFVVEQDHIVILGWSAQIFSVISELIIANESNPRSCIVIMAEKDKVEMEDEIRARVPDTKHTRIVCRTGSPIDLTDLQIVNPDGSKAIIILPGESDNPDSQVIKTILALTNNTNRRADPYHIITEMREVGNLEVGRMIAGQEAKLLLASDFISRITVQTCRQSGLSVVYNELLDFGGDEIYFKREPTLAGKTFGDILTAYDKSCVIGLKHSGGVQINPPLSTVLKAADEVIVIAEDDSTIQLSSATAHATQADAIIQTTLPAPAPESTLILGWNERGTQIIKELDGYVAPGSKITVVSSVEDAEAQFTGIAHELVRQQIDFRLGNTTDRRTLENLNIASYDHVIILSYTDTLEVQEADALTLIALLHLRDIRSKSGRSLPIVSEMLDVRNRELAQSTQSDDFIVSEKLVSLMLSQVAENKDLMAVFDDLFDADGAEIYIRPMSYYIKPGYPVNFYTVVESARRRGELAIGYRLQAEIDQPGKAYGIYINPSKSASITFKAQDSIIVIAND